MTGRLRDALGADVAILNGGAIRGGKAYQGRFTYADLQGEVPFENEMLALVNAQRAMGATCGNTVYPPAPALTMNALLTTAARAHTYDMVNRDFFAHTNPDGDTPGDRITALGFFETVEVSHKPGTDGEHVIVTVELDAEQAWALAQLVKRIGDAVLAAMQRSAAARAQQWNSDRDRLLALVQSGQLDAARALLSQLFPEDDPQDPDGGMTSRVALCEAAARTLSARSHPGPMRDLLGLALESAQIFASWSTSGGEGMARMVKVNELRRRLKQLG